MTDHPERGANGVAVPAVAAQAGAPEAPDSASEHPIAQAINAFTHRVRDIEVAARVHVPLSIQRKKRRLANIKEELRAGTDLVRSSDPHVQAHAIRRLETAIRRLERLVSSSVPQTLQRSLFLGLFSAYDAFSGELLGAIYRRKPELFRTMKRSIEVSDILRFHSFADLQEAVLQEEIESFRRKGYIEQFNDLENTFGLTLRAFQHWPQFVECGQRRNLLTHCDGVVSDQYLRICTEQKVGLDAGAVVGQRLSVGRKYFMTSCQLMMEVGVKLGQTLWRKLFPSELEDADRHIQSLTYATLQDERWDRAQMFAEFAATQKKFARDIDRRIALINWAIALKFGGKGQAAERVLASEDWTASLNEFRLGVAVLHDRFEEAVAIMRRIGREGEVISEHSYHVWPLFHLFRSRPEFLEAYQDVYGRPFIDELSKAAAAAGAQESPKELEPRPEERMIELPAHVDRLGDTVSGSVHFESPERSAEAQRDGRDQQGDGS